MSKLNLRLSGTFRAEFDSVHISRFRTAKTRLLLAYLALEADVPHRRNKLATLLWAGVSDTAAKANLRTTLSNLRQLLAGAPQVLTITRNTVELHSTHVWVDVIEFARRPSLANIELYKGDFLPGFSFQDAPLLEEWRTMHQERLHLVALLTLDDLVRDALHANDLRLVIHLSQLQLSLESWHEQAHHQLIKALALQGHREAALIQYERCIRILNEELSLSPSLELQALVKTLKRPPFPTDLRPLVPAKKPLRHNLPARNPLFIGRENELEQLTRMVLEDFSPVITIVGAGGMGKTQLALEAAGRWVISFAAAPPTPFADGIIFVPLAPIKDPAQIPLAICYALGCDFHEGEAIQTQLLRYLRTRSILFIFDNIDHLLISHGGRDFMTGLLEAAPGCRLILTAEQKCSLEGEAIINLAGLAVGGDAAVPFSGSAARLFLAAARRTASGFDPQPRDQRAIQHICELVEGMPLAIILAAARVDRYDVEQIAAETERDYNFLTSARQDKDIPPRQRSLRATFNNSWHLLSAMERTLLARLAIFRGGFSPRAAEMVTATAVPRLARLIEKSLLIYDGRRHRYHIPELLRQFAAKKLAELAAVNGGRIIETLGTAHANYYLTALSQREEAFRGGSREYALMEVAGDFGNVRGAWRWAVKHHQSSLLGRALDGLFFFYDLSGRERDGAVELEWTITYLAHGSTSEAVAFLQARLRSRLTQMTRLNLPATSDIRERSDGLFPPRYPAAAEVDPRFTRSTASPSQGQNVARAL